MKAFNYSRKSSTSTIICNYIFFLKCPYKVVQSNSVIANNAFKTWQALDSWQLHIKNEHRDLFYSQLLCLKSHDCWQPWTFTRRDSKERYWAYWETQTLAHPFNKHSACKFSKSRKPVLDIISIQNLHRGPYYLFKNSCSFLESKNRIGSYNMSMRSLEWIFPFYPRTNETILRPVWSLTETVSNYWKH